MSNTCNFIIPVSSSFSHSTAWSQSMLFLKNQMEIGHNFTGFHALNSLQKSTHFGKNGWKTVKVLRFHNWSLFAILLDRDAKFFHCDEFVMCASGVVKLWVVLIKLVTYIAACCPSASPLYSEELNAGGFVVQALCKASGLEWIEGFWHSTESWRFT